MMLLIQRLETGRWRACVVGRVMLTRHWPRCSDHDTDSEARVAASGMFNGVVWC